MTYNSNTNIHGVLQFPDGRNDLGYGRTSNKYHKERPVASGGRGIYTDIGPYDEANLDRLKNYEENIDNEEDEVVDKKLKGKRNFLKSKINRKIGTTGSVNRSDPSPHYDKFSNVGAAGAGHTTMAMNCSNDIEGSLIFEACLKEYIYEFINKSRGSSISGQHYFSRAGHSGKLIPPENADRPQSPSGGSYNVVRIDQNKGTASGLGPMNKLHGVEEIDYDSEYDDLSSWELQDISFGEEEKLKTDKRNARNYNKFVN